MAWQAAVKNRAARRDRVAPEHSRGAPLCPPGYADPGLRCAHPGYK
jgi:hypothetical protein